MSTLGPFEPLWTPSNGLSDNKMASNGLQIRLKKIFLKQIADQYYEMQLLGQKHVT